MGKNDNTLSAWADIIMGKPMCTKCKKRASVISAKNKLSVCCSAEIKQIMVDNPLFDTI